MDASSPIIRVCFMTAHGSAVDEKFPEPLAVVGGRYELSSGQAGVTGPGVRLRKGPETGLCFNDSADLPWCARLGSFRSPAPGPPFSASRAAMGLRGRAVDALTVNRVDTP